MINYRTNAYIFLVATVLLLIAAILSPHAESIMDITFFGLSFISGVVTINLFKKHREEKSSGRINHRGLQLLDEASELTPLNTKLEIPGYLEN